MARRSLKDQPYTSNYPPLEAFLRDHEARCDWQISLGGDPDEPIGFVEQHRFPNGKIVIVVVHARQHGWDLFTPGGSPNIAETIADAAARCGLKGG